MVLKTQKGFFEVIKNFKNAFEMEKFEERYIEECFDQYPYIVGDISSGIVRIKGFSNKNQDSNYYKNIEKYIEESCAFRCPYYILKRIDETTYFDLLEKNLTNEITEDANDVEKMFVLTKTAFDKESLILESNPATPPNIVIDMQRINSIPKHELPADLKAIKEQEQSNNNNTRQNNRNNKTQQNNKSQMNSSNQPKTQNKPANNQNNNHSSQKPNQVNKIQNKQGNPNANKNQQKQNQVSQNLNQPNKQANKNNKPVSNQNNNQNSLDNNFKKNNFKKKNKNFEKKEK